MTRDDGDLYSDYRESFADALTDVETRIRRALPDCPCVARLKTLDTTAAKLKRETIRLSQMQDIAGCRIVVSDLDEQDEAVGKLMEIFPGASRQDLREAPHHGYRAVHVIASISGRRVEVQVRTEIQDRWAQLSEKLADKYGVDVKYGGGLDVVQEALRAMSDLGTSIDTRKARVLEDAREVASTEAAIRAALAVGSGLAELKVLEDRARKLEDLHAERKEIVVEAERNFRDTASEIVHMELI